jgi:hypothetical protein
MNFKMFSKAFFGLMLLAAALPACTKTDCPPFADAGFDAWFPYQEGQTIYFTSDKKDKDTLLFNSIYRSPEHRTYGGGGKCNAWAYYSSSYMHVSPKVYLSINTFPGGNALSIKLNEFNLDKASISEAGITTKNSAFSATVLPNIEINGKTFSTVSLLQRDTISNKDVGVYKVWVAKGAGIVSYENYPSREQWVLD